MSNKRRTTASQGKGSKSSQNIRGSKFTPSDVPPSLSLTPFNSVILRLREAQKSPWNITVGDIHATMVKQLGFTGISFTGEAGFEFKLIGISVWNVSDGNSDISLIPRDPSLSNSTELARIDSMSMRNMYGRCGYHFPVHVSSSVLHSVKDSTKQVASIYATRPGYEVHLRVQWRGAYFSFSSGLTFEDFKDISSVRSDIDAEIDEAECRLRILELKRSRGSRPSSVIGN